MHRKNTLLNLSIYIPSSMKCTTQPPHLQIAFPRLPSNPLNAFRTSLPHISQPTFLLPTSACQQQACQSARSEHYHVRRSPVSFPSLKICILAAIAVRTAHAFCCSALHIRKPSLWTGVPLTRPCLSFFLSFFHSFINSADFRPFRFRSRYPITNSQNTRDCCPNCVRSPPPSSLSLFPPLPPPLFSQNPKSLIPTPLLVPWTNERPDRLAPPINPILIPRAPPGHLYESGGDEEAEAGEGAGDAVAVAGGALFALEGVDAVLGMLGGEGAAETHGGLMYSGRGVCSLR